MKKKTHRMNNPYSMRASSEYKHTNRPFMWLGLEGHCNSHDWSTIAHFPNTKRKIEGETAKMRLINDDFSPIAHHIIDKYDKIY